MSTETGQSALHPLHARHRSRASFCGLAPPVAADHLAAHELEEEVRAAARRVLLLPRGHEARAHGAAGRAPAFPHAEAALGGRRKLPPSSAKLKYVGSARGL